jgi:regulatory protein
VLDPLIVPCRGLSVIRSEVRNLSSSLVFLRTPHLFAMAASPLTFTLCTMYFVLLYFLAMFSRALKLNTEDELYDLALRALTRRAHSVHEMKQKLARRTDNELLVRVVLARLKENGQLDDQRYAQQFTRSRSQSRKQGQFRIQRELRARGVSDGVISTALEESASQTDPAATVRQRIERKLKSYGGPVSGKKIDDKKIAAIYASLLRAGFPSDLIRKELNAFTREPVPDVDQPEEG